MERRQIGKTGLNVTVLGFGGAPLGNLFAVVPEDEAQATLQAAWASGRRLFDTAPLYGYGLSERRVGDALRDRPRDEFVLSTKVGRLIRRGWHENRVGEVFRTSMPFHAVFDYSYDGAMRSMEDSYQRLGLDRIDIALIHDIAADTHRDNQPAVFKAAMEGAYRALDELRRNGQVKAIGLGVNQADVCLDAMKYGDFDCFLLAGRYTLLEQDALNDLMPACAARDISIIIGGPFNSGILARADAADATYNYELAPESIRARVRQLVQACERHRVSLPTAALQFVLTHPVVASVIPGARNAAEAASHHEMLSVKIPQAFWKDLRDSGLLHPSAPVPATTA
ncbi:MAG TPA: aldo/keto reductase [Terriglobales bacterium]|nr:aldo/keto reductase [Terriglobales bacterium]